MKSLSGKLFEYKTDSHGVGDYFALCREIIERG
jgi:hypothetical protein